MMEFAKSSWDHLFAEQNAMLQCSSFQPSLGPAPSTHFPAAPGAAEYWKDEEPYERQVAPSLSVDQPPIRPPPDESFKNLERFLLHEQPPERPSISPTHMYFSSPHSACVSPMAFWRLTTRELVAFNDAFTHLVEYPHGILQKAGFRWEDFRAEMWFDNPELVMQLDSSLKHLQHTHELILSGQCEFAQLDFAFISGTGRVKMIALTIVTMGEEVMWLCQEVPELRRHSIQEVPRMSSSLRSMENTVPDHLHMPPPFPCRNEPGAPGVPRLRSASFDATLSSNTRGKGAERKLVKVQTRVKKPWDCNLVKFSLKTDRKKRQKPSLLS